MTNRKTKTGRAGRAASLLLTMLLLFGLMPLTAYAAVVPPPPAASGGFTLGFADGSVPQAGAKWGDGDYYDSGSYCLYLHPQNGKELLLSGGDGLADLWFISPDAARPAYRARLTGGVSARDFSVGSYKYYNGTTIEKGPVDLSLNGGGHIMTVLYWFFVNASSRLDIAGGLTVDGDISLSPDSTLRARGSFAQTGGHRVDLSDGARFQLEDEPAADWLNRLAYDDWGETRPNGQGRAIFSDGEYIVDKNGVTRVTAEIPSVPSFASRTLLEPVSGVEVSGIFTGDSMLEVWATLPHEAGECAACDEIRARKEAGEVLALYDVRLRQGQRKGELEVALPVGAKYDGQTLLLLHCNGRVLESRTVTVENGMAAGTFVDLSPFAAVKPGGTAEVAADAPETAPTTTPPVANPQTGVPGGGEGWIAALCGLAAGAVLLCALLRRRGKRGA